MSIEQSTNAIARRDAADRASRVSTESEAIKLIARAQAEGDTMFVEALRAEIARRWPLPSINWRDKLTASNTIIDEVLRMARTDERMKQIGVDYSQARITRAFAKDEMNAYAAARDWRAKLDALETEASTVSEKAALNFDMRFNELTTIPGDVNAQLLAEMRATKEWERIKRDIDSKELGQAAKYLTDLFENGTVETRYVIKTEAPSYMRSHGIDIENLLVDAITRSDADLSRFRQDKIQASKYADAVRWNIKLARKRIEELPTDVNNVAAGDVAGMVKTF